MVDVTEHTESSNLLGRWSFCPTAQHYDPEALELCLLLFLSQI